MSGEPAPQEVGRESDWYMPSVERLRCKSGERETQSKNSSPRGSPEEPRDHHSDSKANGDKNKIFFVCRSAHFYVQATTLTGEGSKEYKQEERREDGQSGAS